MAVSGHVVRWSCGQMGPSSGKKTLLGWQLQECWGLHAAFLGPDLSCRASTGFPFCSRDLVEQRWLEERRLKCVCVFVCVRAHVMCVFPFMWGSEDTGPSSLIPYTFSLNTGFQLLICPRKARDLDLETSPGMTMGWNGLPFMPC